MMASRVVIVYLLLAIVSALVTLLLGRQIGLYRFLPARCQEARKTAIRMRLLVSCSIYVLGYAFIGVALAMKNGHAGYFDDGFVQIIHILLHPIIMFAVSMLAEYWVATIPPQLVPPGSLAAKLSTAAEKHKLFIAIGSFNAGTVAVFGVVTFVNPLLGVALADLAIASGAFIAIVAVMFVANQITGFINQATAKASASSRAFYSTAKASLWQQAVGLCSVGVVAISIITVRNLAPAGRSTPVIMFTIQALSGHAFGVVSTLTTRFQAVSATGSTAAITGASKATSARRSAFILSPRNVAAFTAKLVLPKTNGGGLNIYSKTGTPGDDGIEAHRGEVFEVEDGTRRGAGILPEGLTPDRGAGTAKVGRVIPTVLDPAEPPRDLELDSFREEDDVSCGYSLQTS